MVRMHLYRDVLDDLLCRGFTFVGFKCYYDGSKNLVDRQWVDVTATIKKEYYPDFEGDGPVLYAEKVVLTGPPEEEVVYFS